MQTTRRAGPLTTLIITIAFICIGYVVAFNFGLPILQDAKDSTTWPTASGKIIHSKIVSKSKDGKTTFSADVLYGYSANNEHYENTNVSFGGNYSTSDSRKIRSIVNQYKKGASVKVFYNPTEPQNSVLEPGATWSSYMVFGFGLVFLGAGLLIGTGFIIKIVFGGAIIFAAVGGLIGRKSQEMSAPTPKPSPTNHDIKENTTIQNDTTIKPDNEDDGFDMG